MFGKLYDFRSSLQKRNFESKLDLKNAKPTFFRVCLILRVSGQMLAKNPHPIFLSARGGPERF